MARLVQCAPCHGSVSLSRLAAPGTRPYVPLLTPCCAVVVSYRLGLNLEVRNGELVLLEPFTACQEGTPITPEQAKLLVSPQPSLTIT